MDQHEEGCESRCSTLPRESGTIQMLEAAGATKLSSDIQPHPSCINNLDEGKNQSNSVSVVQDGDSFDDTVVRAANTIHTEITNKGKISQENDTLEISTSIIEITPETCSANESNENMHVSESEHEFQSCLNKSAGSENILQGSDTDCSNFPNGKMDKASTEPNYVVHILDTSCNSSTAQKISGLDGNGLRHEGNNLDVNQHVDEISDCISKTESPCDNFCSDRDGSINGDCRNDRSKNLNDGFYNGDNEKIDDDIQNNKHENIINDDIQSDEGENISDGFQTNDGCHQDKNNIVQSLNIKQEPDDSDYTGSQLNDCSGHGTENTDSRFIEESAFPDQYSTHGESTSHLSSEHQNDKSYNNVTSSDNNGGCEAFKVIVKLEPEDSAYERPKLNYRRPIVVYSDTDDTADSDDGSSSSSSVFSYKNVASDDYDVDDYTDYDDYTDDDFTDDELLEGLSKEERIERLKARRIRMLKARNRTQREVFPEELPPLEYLVISPEENVDLQPLGVVSGVVNVLVVVKANARCPALHDDTVLFLEGRRPLGLVFEIFGTVEQPYYSVRFNNSKDIEDQGVTVGDMVFYAPKANNLTKYVFLTELRKMRSDDASWEDDNEPPINEQDFSDDEKERIFMRRLHNIRRREIRKEKNEESSSHRKRQRRRRRLEHDKDPKGPQLLPGDLNKNPFGKTSQKSRPAKSRPALNHNHKGKNGCGPRPVLPSQSSPALPPSLPPSFIADRKPWPTPASFGHGPGWPGMFGNVQLPPPQPGGFQFRFPPPSFNTSIPPPPLHCGPGPGPTFPQNPLLSTASPAGGPYFFGANVQHTNTAVPPPKLQNQKPPGFPIFDPSHPPPVVSPVFNRPPPPPQAPLPAPK